MKAAAIYCRVSSKGQEDNASLETQEAACREYATKQGYAVAAVYRETHTGAELRERPQLSELREALRRGEVAAIIAYSVDRLAREQAHLYILLDEAERAGAELLFATEEFDKTPMGKLILSVRGFMAEAEREKIRERTLRGREARVKSGKLAGNSRPPYGLGYNEGKTAFLIDEATAPIVRRIFALAVAGTSLRAIAKALTAEGIPSPTGRAYWDPSSVRTILVNEAYTGVVHQRKTVTTKTHGKETKVARPPEEQIITTGVCPVVIDRETFDAVRARLARNLAEAPRNCKNPEGYLLRGGYVRDAATGRVMCVQRSSRQIPMYRHQVRRPSPGDRTHAITAPTLDSEVWAFVGLLLSDRAIIERELAAVVEGGDGAAEVASVDRRLATVAKQQANLGRAVAMLDDEEAMAPLLVEMKALAEQKKALTAEREGLAGRAANAAALRSRLDSLAEMGAAFRAAAATMGYAERREWLAALGLVVEVRPAGDGPRYGVSLGIPLPDGTEERIAISGSCSARRRATFRAGHAVASRRSP